MGRARATRRGNNRARPSRARRKSAGGSEAGVTRGNDRCCGPSVETHQGRPQARGYPYDLTVTNSNADNKAGIKRIAIALRNPGGVYRWGEVNRSDNQTALVATINTQVLEPFVEPGAWDVTELTVGD